MRLLDICEGHVATLAKAVVALGTHNNTGVYVSASVSVHTLQRHSLNWLILMLVCTLAEIMPLILLLIVL